jgi:TRAP-type mannitol/chloroaromatic compound transport system permease large subunit
MTCAATVGLVIPPSLVLILMGDAMMRAHTEAFNNGLSSGTHQHVMNTQDMFHAALLPGMLLFILWAAVGVFTFKIQSEQNKDTAHESMSYTTAYLAIFLIFGLLAGVFSGWLYAVEAAASGCLLLGLYMSWKSRKNISVWRDILQDTFAFSGSLLTLLMAATTFSLIFRLYETDQYIANWIAHSVSDTLHIFIIFAGVALCAWMMDAFELIFVIIPIVSPGLILLMGDAQQVAVLLLLVIQMSFLLPPMGYSVVIASQTSRSVGKQALLKSLLPYLLALVFVFLCLLVKPNWVHLLDGAL